MPKFISDDEMAVIEKSAPKASKKKFISDEEMASLSANEEAQFSTNDGIDLPSFMETIGIPNRAALAALRSGQEAVGGDPKKPWENVLHGERDLALDVIRAVTAPSGSPPENQEDASGVEKFGSFALGAGTDPLNYIPIGAIAKGIGAVGKGARSVEVGGAKLAGWAAEPLTLGRISKDGMEHAAKDFSPIEQFFAKDTLNKVRKEYGPLKTATDEFLVGARSPSEMPYNMKPVKITPGSVAEFSQSPSGQEAMDAIADMEVAYKNLQRQMSDATIIGDVPVDLEVGAPVLQALMGKLQNFKGLQKGFMIGPQAAEINNMLNKLNLTPLGNPRAVPGEFQSAYARLQKAMHGVIKESAPELAAGREKFHAAASMNVGRAGGKMSEMMRQEDLNQALRMASQSLITPDAGKISQALFILGKSGPMLNRIVAGFRIPPRVLAEGMEGLASYIAKNPQVGKAMQIAITRELEGEIPEEVPSMFEIPNLGSEEPPIDPGNSSPPEMINEPPANQPMPQPMAAPPLPPPIDPKDQALMDLTGLASIMGGKIQDPAERMKFADDVANNPALTARQRMIIKIKARRDGTIVLPQELP